MTAQSKREGMPKLSLKERKHSFKEVALGYTEWQAVSEAKRCLQCKKPACVSGCPVEIDIPAFIKDIREGEFDKAISKIKEKNCLPAIAGRVCPQESQCQEKCVLGIRGSPISIGALERFVADQELKSGVRRYVRTEARHGQVAVIGSGPFGLTAAAELAKAGYEVIIFEALHEVGGVLTYGIPEFRLPKAVVKAEAEYVKSIGVSIEIDKVVGKVITIEELFAAGFKAVFIGTGAGAPTFLGIPGENLNGIYSANEFLTRVNLMKAYKFPDQDTPIRIGKRVVVIGGGNVAFDSARTALRLGAEEVSIVYRRTEKEMPTRLEEVHNAREEGIKFALLTNPIRFMGNDSGWVSKVQCIKMQLGEPDESGRRRPVPVKGSEFTMDADTVIVAIGTRANPLIQSTTKGLKVDGEGHIIVDELGRTSIEGVYAGGDVTTGSATVIEAMRAGKVAAKVFISVDSAKR